MSVAAGERSTTTAGEKEPYEREAYEPQADVDKVARHFVERYGTLEKALKALGPECEFDLCTFEVALKKWGIRVDSVVDFFSHVDLDWSGTISVEELFEVLKLPALELQAREAQRQKNEVTRICEELGYRIQSRFGSVSQYFAKLSAEGGQGDLSKAKFSKLVRDLDVELEPEWLGRVFRSIDENGSGKISMRELESALNDYLVRSIHSNLAARLMEKYGSIRTVFETVFPSRGDVSSLNRSKQPPPLPTLGGDEGSPDASVSPTGVSSGVPRLEGISPVEPLTEGNFVRVLGMLTQDEASIKELRQMHAALQPISFDELKAKLASAEAAHLEQKKKEQTEQRREAQAQKAAARGFNSRTWAETRVQAWIDARECDLLGEEGAPLKGAGLLDLGAVEVRPPAGAAMLPGGFAEDATRDWAAAARSGRSRAQLKDYIEDFRSRIKSYEGEQGKLMATLRNRQDEAEALRDFLPLRSSFEASPRSPSTPYTPYLMTPASRRMSSPKAQAVRHVPPLSQEARVARAERLIQAASSGNVAEVQRLLAVAADPNLVGWSGVTPLMAAARHGRQGVLEALLARQADPCQTDMHGRTAVDHAHSRPATREWLRSCGGHTGKELAAQAEALAREVLRARAEAKRLDGLVDRLPSEDVLRQARLRRQLQGQEQTPAASRTAASGSRPMWPAWSPVASGSPELSPYGAASSLAATPQPPSCLSAGRARHERHVNIMLPSEAVRGPRHTRLVPGMYS